MRWGLTGGMGSGKSTVCHMLARRGATVIDADAISRATTAPDGLAIAPLTAAFGPSILRADGALDRAAMRQRMCADSSTKTQLEAIIHPLVKAEMQRQSQEAQEKGARGIVFDIPLLVESAYWGKQFDRIWVVDCTPATQIERIMHRNGFSEQEARNMLANQASRSTRLHAADAVIFNDGLSIDQLALKVSEISGRFGL